MNSFIGDIAWIVVSPLNALLLLLLLGCIVYVISRKAGAVVIGTGVVLFLLLGLIPVGKVMLSSLENQYQRPAALPEYVTGIIVLGGVFDTAVSASRGMPVMYDSSERVVDALWLAQLYPDAKIVFSGGNGSLNAALPPEADIFEVFAGEFNLPPERITYERGSRNTYENLLNSKLALKPTQNDVWIMVTSAYHMPRALALSKSVAWPGAVIAWPTDYQTTADQGFIPRRLDVSGNFHALALALREHASFIRYRINGMIL